MAWQVKMRREIADVSLLGWIQELMQSLSDLEILGGKFSTIADGDHLVSFAFWNSEHKNIQTPELPRGTWSCQVVGEGKLEDVLQSAVKRLDALEDMSLEAAFHTRLIVTPGKSQLGRLAFYSPPVDGKVAEQTNSGAIESAVSDLVSEQKVVREMFSSISTQMAGLSAEIEKIKAGLESK